MNTRRNSGGRIPIFTIILSLLVVASGIFGGVYYQKYQDLKKDSSKTADQKNAELVDRINKVFELPKDETPTVVVVTKEPSEFTTEQEKSFSETFKQLKKGDYILLYEKAGKAIHYRESENKVIDTATLSVAGGAAVHIIGNVEAQNSTQTTLESKFTDKIRIASKATTTNQYGTTVVIDSTGKNAALASEIATALKASVATSLPSGESVPDGSEIVVILSSSAK